MSIFLESVVIRGAGKMDGDSGGQKLPGGPSKPGPAHEKDANEVPLTSNQRRKARRDGPSDTKKAKEDREKALADLPKLDYEHHSPHVLDLDVTSIPTIQGNFPPSGFKLSDWWIGDAFVSGLQAANEVLYTRRILLVKGWIRQGRKTSGCASKIIGPQGWQ